MARTHRILVVEDEPNVGFGLQFNLEQEGYDVTLVETLHAASALGDRIEKWPDPYLPGREQMWRLAEREDVMTGKV